MQRRPTEDGFVLITALWLLLLCGSVVALTMARNSSRAQVVRTEATELQQRLDFEAAIDTIVADLVVQGPASPWAQLPSEGPVTVDGRTLHVAISSEAGRLDLNSGDIATIDRALQGLGAAGSDRAAFRTAIEGTRADGKRFMGFSDAAPILALLHSLPCPARWFTLYSGLTQPDETQTDDELARAMGRTGSSGFGRQPMKPGTPLRLNLQHPDGSSLQTIIRVGGPNRPYDVLHWARSIQC